MRFALVVALAIGMIGCNDALAIEQATRPHVDELHFERRGQTRARLDGASFPDGVIALTWDDGPDTGTLALARYLSSQKVAATFFVVGEWREGISADPGNGANVFATGYERLPILEGLVGLGHRLGNHTRNHALLWKASPDVVAEQLARAQAEIDPFLTNELRMFRAPGGAFDREAEIATHDPLFAEVRGPVHWDIDRKDWQASLDRVPPAEIAARYLAAIESARRGIVLLHDRVGDVGSTYALDVAQKLVPALRARNFVFAAPILSFSPLRERLAANATSFADVDGDGHADACFEREGSVVCRTSKTVRSGLAGVPFTSFEATELTTKKPPGDLAFGDLDGDKRADVCVLGDDVISCARSTPSGFSPFEPWSTNAFRTLKLADVDGDGRFDACGATNLGLLCMTSHGKSFATPRVWLEGVADVQLSDVNGDGRADACVVDGDIRCALSTGKAFASLAKWGDPLTNARLGDLNGDGLRDICGTTKEGVACAFSNGSAFTTATTWLHLDTEPSAIALADVNGDRKSDLCLTQAARTLCAMAP